MKGHLAAEQAEVSGLLVRQVKSDIQDELRCCAVLKRTFTELASYSMPTENQIRCLLGIGLLGTSRR